MISCTFGTFVLGYWLGPIVGRSAYHKRSLARGGSIGTNPLILNEGRTIRSNGVDTASANRVPADCSSRGGNLTAGGRSGYAMAQKGSDSF